MINNDDRFRRVKTRYDTEAHWEADNPYLEPFQIGVVVNDAGLSVASKMGPGYWNDLPDYTNTVVGVGGQGPQGNDGPAGPKGDKGDPGDPVSASAAWPIGSVFISVVNTNPGTLLGFGTWVAFAAGRTLIGLDGNQTEFDTVEETGGAKTVAASGTVSQPVATGSAVADHASHTHSVTSNVAVGDHASHTHGVTSNVAVAAHVFTQPTVSWPAGVPTASGAAVADHAAHTHSVTSNVAVADHAALAAHSHELPFQIPSTTTTRQLAAATFGTGTSRVATAVSAAGTGNTTSAAVALSESKSAGTPSAHSVTNNAVTSGNPSATLSHSVTQPTIAWPAGVPTNAGGSVDNHQVTNNAVTSGGPSATLSHSVTNNAVTSGGPSATLAHSVTQPTISQPTFTGAATSVVQPYIVVYMFKRTA